VDTLPPDDARAVRDCLEATRFFELPETELPVTAPDARSYTISVFDAAHSRTVQLSDPLGDERLEALVETIRRLGRQ
jgi:hypothetical protein